MRVFLIPRAAPGRGESEQAWKPRLHPRLRLEQQWLVARQLLYVSIGIMFAYPVLIATGPTIRAIASQLLLVLDTPG